MIPTSHELAELKKAHEPSAISERLAAARSKHNYVGDMVLGGIDGCVTTFAIMASAMGAGFSNTVIITLGLANLAADGFSMAVSNYQATQSHVDKLESTRKSEELHIDILPEGEREEVRQIFSQKGFEGEVLERIVETITSNKKLWIETMLQEEHGLTLYPLSPLKSGFSTFTAFVLIGILPLIPFFLFNGDQQDIFTFSCIIASCAFFGIGLSKGWVLGIAPWKPALSTLLSGAAAASLAFGMGYWLETIL